MRTLTVTLVSLSLCVAACGKGTAAPTAAACQ